MKRSLVYSLLAPLSFAAAARAVEVEVEWRAVGQKPVQPAARPAQEFVPVSAQNTAPSAPIPFGNIAIAPATAAQAPAEQPQPIAPPIVVPAYTPPAATLPPAPPPPTGPAPSASVPISVAPQQCGPAESTYVWAPTEQPGGQMFARAEYLLWVVTANNGPPLLTGGPPLPFGPNGPLVNNVGALGQPGTFSILSVNELDEQLRQGIRLTVGGWCDPCRTKGYDVSAFFTFPRKGSFAANETDFDRLFRPFFALNPGISVLAGQQPGEYRELVYATEIGATGTFTADLRSFFWGAEANCRHCLYRDCGFDADWFIGLRYLNLDEALRVAETTNFNQTINFIDSNGNVLSTIPAGTKSFVVDQFKTRNDFYGGQIGANLAWQRNRWSFEMRPVLAMGATRQRLTVEGEQDFTAPDGTVTTFTGGLLALPGNIRTETHTVFTVVPQITLQIGYQVTSNLRAFVGYDYLWWSSVIRPGDQVDRNLDINRIPNFDRAQPIAGVHPAPLFNKSDFWAQGANVGMEYRW